MRILYSDTANPSSGDIALALGTVRRLINMKAEVSCFYRLSQEEFFKKAGLNVKHIQMPIEDAFQDINTAHDLVKVFSSKFPENYKHMCNQMLSHDLLVIGPGGRFTEGFKNDRNLVTPAVAQSLGLPVIILNQSVGPIDNTNHQQLIKEIFTKSHRIFIRDNCSLDFLFNLGIPRDKIVRCGDVVFGESYPLLDKHEYDLGINIRTGYNGHVKIEALIYFLKAYKQTKPNANILIYSTTFDIPSHIEIMLKPYSNVQVTMPHYPNYLIDIGRCALNISDSLHGVIFSLKANRPVICCQTGLRTWKIQGMYHSGDEPLEVLAGFTSSINAMQILDRVLTIERYPTPYLMKQSKILIAETEKCENGWDLFKNHLAEIKLNKHKVYNHQE